MRYTENINKTKLLWDGNGDCDTNGKDLEKLAPETLLNLVVMHYYGDIMAVSAEVAANNAVEARKYMDDYLEFHSLIVESMKPAFDTSFFKEDKDLNSAMNDYDAQIKRVGFPLKKQKINRS